MKKNFTLFFKFFKSSENQKQTNLKTKDEFEHVYAVLDQVNYSPSQNTLNSILNYSKSTTFVKTSVDDATELFMN